MPLTPQAITQSVISAGPELKGQDWYRFATAVGIATNAWAVIPSNLVLNGVTIGTLGVGSANGKVFIPPIPAPVMGAVTVNGLLGIVTPSMARAVAVGVANAFTATAAYTGVSLGVGLGADVTKILVSNPATLIASFMTTFSSLGMTGVNIPRLSSAYGSGIASLMLLGFGVGAVIGPPTIVPGPGVSISGIY